MLSIHPYLNFPGNTEEAFEFYKEVFGTEFTSLLRMRDNEETNSVPPEVQNKIMHIALPLTKDTTLMATDAIETPESKLIVGNNFYILINAENETEANTLYTKLAAGGIQEMPMSTTFWGAYFGSLVDKFGIKWMINYNLKDVNK
jgi:PhnB protein